MPSPFTPEQLTSLSLQIEQQLAQLQEESAPSDSKDGDLVPEEITDCLPAQWQVIATVTKEEPRSFWQKFKQAARRDLCEEGGVLYAQWQRYRDLSSRAGRYIVRRQPSSAPYWRGLQRKSRGTMHRAPTAHFGHSLLWQFVSPE